MPTEEERVSAGTPQPAFLPSSRGSTEQGRLLFSLIRDDRSGELDRFLFALGPEERRAAVRCDDGTIFHRPPLVVESSIKTKEVLLKHGADANQFDSNGITALAARLDTRAQLRLATEEDPEIEMLVGGGGKVDFRAQFKFFGREQPMIMPSAVAQAWRSGDRAAVNLFARLCPDETTQELTSIGAIRLYPPVFDTSAGLQKEPGLGKIAVLLTREFLRYARKTATQCRDFVKKRFLSSAFKKVAQCRNFLRLKPSSAASKRPSVGGT